MGGGTLAQGVAAVAELAPQPVGPFQVGADRGGRPVSVFQAASDLGGVIGPLLAGALADAASPTAAFGSAFVLLALTALAGLRIPRSRAL